MSKNEIAPSFCKAARQLEGGLLSGRRGLSAPYLQELGLTAIGLLAPGDHLFWEEILQEKENRRVRRQLLSGEKHRDR